MLAESAGKISLKGKDTEHVHDENCQHDHDHAPEPAEPQGRNDYDLLAIRGTKDKTTDPLVKVSFSIGSKQKVHPIALMVVKPPFSDSQSSHIYLHDAR